MPVSAVQSGYQILQQSSRIADNSSREINQAQLKDYPNVDQNKPELPSIEAFPDTNNLNTKNQPDINKPSALYSSPPRIKSMQSTNSIRRINTQKSGQT
ncbi:hypothetical protein [Vibrio aerogenes]|uniref:hypothetical protein n=1 Tax=Vibrio aerogenes TaxID=92172 RepID=UPI000A02771E|nr:hypothetical protein [Vibrio aerogenes]